MRNKRTQREGRTWREVREHALAELRRAEEMRIAAAEEESRRENSFGGTFLTPEQEATARGIINGTVRFENNENVVIAFLSAALATNDELRKMYSDAQTQIHYHKKNLQECQKDTERLDWIQSEFHPMEIDVFPDRCFITFFGIDEVRYSAPTLREALDKAINGDEPDKLPSYRLNNDE